MKELRYLKTFENMAQAKSIISKKMEGFDKLKNLLVDNLGFIGKFTEYLMNENIPYSDLVILYNDLLFLKKANNTIDLSKMRYEEVLDKIQIIKNDLSINSLIREFPSVQKKMANDLLNNNYNIFLQISKREDIRTFISKISRYKSKDDLLSAIKIFNKNASNDSSTVREYVKTSNSNIVYDKNNIIIVNVKELKDVQHLGSDTSWCILTKGMWDDYTKNRYQYIAYNYNTDEYDPMFKIGFTLNTDQTLYAAHDILDNSAKKEITDLLSSENINREDLLNIEGMYIPTDEDINKLRKSERVRDLMEYSKFIRIEDLPLFVNKLMTFYTPRELENISNTRREIFEIAINRYFSQYNLVTHVELSEFSQSYYDNRSKIKTYKTLKGKLIDDNLADFSEDNIENKIKYINKWDDKAIIFGSGSIYLYSIFNTKGNIATPVLPYTKEILTKISDRFNKISDEFLLRKEFESYYVDFVEAKSLLNYALGRKELSEKDLPKLSKTLLSKFTFLFKVPVDLYNITELNDGNIDLIIKKDYSGIFLSTELLFDARAFDKLMDRLSDNKIGFTIRKRTVSQVGYAISRLGKDNPVIQVYSKINSRSRIGDVFKSDDGRISIEII